MGVAIFISLLSLEWLPDRKQFYYVLGCLFEYDKAVNVPSIEPYSVVPVIHELRKDFQTNVHYFVIVIEGIQGPLYDHWEILRVEPIKK